MSTQETAAAAGPADDDGRGGHGGAAGAGHAPDDGAGPKPGGGRAPHAEPAAPGEPAEPARAAERAERSERAELPERLSQLATAPADERESALLDLVREQAEAVLGHRANGDVEPDRPFREAGFTSLIAVELRDALREVTGVALPSTVLFRYPTPLELARHLDAELFPPAGPGPAGTGPAGPGAGGAGLTALWADVARLEHRIAATAVDDDTRGRVADRLRSLLRTLDEGAGAPPGGAAAGDGIDTASDDEMFALINKELGIG
ncbi:phosphopantetheine-binding protein [Streptomyces sp. 796.1]|uniref:phosphopantetheine-binding protein n=1 Tax=Streptomyces sp. 796.1 TaxID=3163029 RepID=UPI0039C95DFC